MTGHPATGDRRITQGISARAASTGAVEWWTPAHIAGRARIALRGIDLDPCSTPEANETIRAVRIFTRADDGLAQPWPAGDTVWMNPPYARGVVGKWIARVVAHDGPAIVLVNNCTETKWGQALLGAANIVCFPAGRIRYRRPDGSTGPPVQGQMLVGLRVDPTRFRNAFDGVGILMR